MCHLCVGSDGTPNLSRPVCEYGDCDETPLKSSVYCFEHNIQDPTGERDVGRPALLWLRGVPDPVRAKVREYKPEGAAPGKPGWVLRVESDEARAGTDHILDKLQLRRALGLYEAVIQASRARASSSADAADEGDRPRPEAGDESELPPPEEDEVIELDETPAKDSGQLPPPEEDEVTELDETPASDSGQLDDKLAKFLDEETQQSRMALKCKSKDLQSPRKRRRTACVSRLPFRLQLTSPTQLLARRRVLLRRPVLAPREREGP